VAKSTSNTVAAHVAGRCGLLVSHTTVHALWVNLVCHCLDRKDGGFVPMKVIIETALNG
jgi:hypothetical protein